MAKVIYRDEVITETVIAEGLLTGITVGTWQPDYPLREVDFFHIKSGKPVTYNWASSILLTSIGFGFNILAKYLSQSDSNNASIAKGEWIVFGYGIGISIILYGIGRLLPNERRKVMKNIKDHFETAPKSRKAFKRAK
ncbi:MAG: hypothetical protein K8S62_06485 [Candidatus Sabulitectum sp.]|nr:hypothetical protein [Candidatus Sabulitectum sp.]